MPMMTSRPHTHISIPSGAAPPTDPSPNSWSPYLFQSPPQDPPNIWADHVSSAYSSSTYASAPRISLDVPSRPPSRPASFYEPDSPRVLFPEPQLLRSASQRSSLRPSPTPAHRATKSELTVSPSHVRGESRPPSFVSTESSPDLSPRILSDELSCQTLESEEGLRRFQAGELPESDEEWHRLVPPGAREVLDGKEVQRQSVLFEVIKSERDYVHDLELVKEVFVDPLVNTSPVPQRRLRAFIHEVFYNFDEILAHHQRMLGSLFARQREQHPLVQSVADIILDTTLLFRSEYEAYIKHYPLAEARHRSELKHNNKYQYFIQQCSLDPRIRKRDLITFLSRPVTRLPRLSLVLQHALKRTEPDHPDAEMLPLILNILSDFIKSTQPGIEAAEGKVKFWNLCESLVYQKGEILDLDLYDDSRTLVYSGPLARRYRVDVGYNWADLHVALMDNYLLLLKPETRSSGIIKHSVVSRPIPLEFLRLASFSSPPEQRREKVEEGGILDSFRSRTRLMYPFTVYHASAKMTRRYTLYASTDAVRQKWNAALVDAMGVRKVRQEANMWFAPHVLNEDFFKYSTSAFPFGQYTGKITAASPLSSGGKNFIVVGCSSGIYATVRGESAFVKVLNITHATNMVAVPDHNKFLILSDLGLFSYSLDLFARVAQGLSPSQHLEATLERLAGQDSTVHFFRAGRVGNRTMVLYASRTFLQVRFYASEIVNAIEATSPRRSVAGPLSNLSFRPFGEPLDVPKDAHDVVVLHRNVGICTDRGIWIVDPTNLSMSSASPTIIPKFGGADNNPPMYTLKTRCTSARPLGLVRCDNDEILVVYDELGCYIDKHGVPSRQSGYLRWESKATAFAHRDNHILLFSPEFIEIRTVHTGKLVQIIEGVDVRPVYHGLLPTDKTVLVAMQGRDDRGTVIDKIIELVETSEITTPRVAAMPAMWDEWDM